MVEIAAIYLINHSGVPIYSRALGDKLSHDGILFSGVITAIKKILMELNIGDTNSFQTSDFTVYLYSEEDFLLTFILEDTGELIQKELDDLHNVIIEKVNPVMELEKGYTYSDNLKSFLDLTITSAYAQWSKRFEQSKTSRKVSDSLW